MNKKDLFGLLVQTAGVCRKAIIKVDTLEAGIARLHAREAEARIVISRLLESLPLRLGSVVVDDALERAKEWLNEERK